MPSPFRRFVRSNPFLTLGLVAAVVAVVAGRHGAAWPVWLDALTLPILFAPYLLADWILRRVRRPPRE
jgi:hypothetical protein